MTINSLAIASMIFKEKKDLQSAYDKLNNIANKLNDKDRKKLFNCPWPKKIIAAWEKLH